jgi:hypothetical protein
MKRGGRNVVHIRRIQHLLNSFIIREEEYLVLHDGSTEAAAELVSTERRRRGSVEEGPGIEIVVAEELVSRPVKLVGAGFGYSIDGTAVAGILRVPVKV